MYRLLLSLSFLGLCAAVAGGDDCDGCPIQRDPNSPEVLEWADKVIAKVQADTNLPHCLYREVVYNATSQVVAGAMYRLTFRAGHCIYKPPNCAQKVKQGKCGAETSDPDLNIKASLFEKLDHTEEITFEILH